MLFADLSGYTALCQARDPEDVHLLVRPLMNALRRECERGGALVPSIEGDGFMAVFGARVAHEDDPLRALDVGVRLQEVVAARQVLYPELPQLHVGIHVGEVVVAPSWESAEVSLSGDVVNVASRLCGVAAPGEVLVTHEFARLTELSAGWSAPRHVSLRGREGEVRVQSYDWVGFARVLGGARRSSSSPYVARAGLERKLLHALAHGDGCLLVGEAGLGKSRLVSAMLSGQPVLRATCAQELFPTARAVALALLSCVDSAPSGLMRVLEGDGQEDGSQEAEPSILRAAGRALASWQGIPLVVLEDAERLPDDEIEALETLRRESGQVWIVLSRRDLPEVSLARVQVESLDEGESATLLEHLLPRASAELSDVVLRRAGDSPLYLEQCCQLLVESGAVALGRQGSTVVLPKRLREIPTSMRLFVSARLDLLGPTERRLVGIASVLGDTPEVDLLCHLSGDDGDGVERLVERGLLKWIEGSLGQPSLVFSHALVRDVAYETLLRRTRTEIHRAAADWYSVLPVSRVLEHQAHHLEAAVRGAEADCDLLNRTVEAMVLYARSVEQERNRVSRDVLARARELVEARPECAAETLSLELAWSSVSFAAGDDEVAQQAALRALALAEDRHDDAAVAEAHLGLARALMVSHQSREAEDHLERAALAYSVVPDAGGQARVELERAFMATISQGTGQYLAALERAYPLAMRSGDARLQASAAQQLALHHAIATGRDAFELWAARAVEVSRDDDVGLTAKLELSRAILAMFDLNAEAGLESSYLALVAGRELGLRHVYSNALVVHLDLLILAGRSEAQEVLEEARVFASSRPAQWWGLQLDLLEARLALRAGNTRQALLLLQHVADHELAVKPVLKRDLDEARAWVALERGHFGEARALASRAVVMDEQLSERCAPMRPRLVDLVGAVANGESVALGDISALRSAARETGLTTISDLATRWLYVEELTRGWAVDLHGLVPVDVIEARALDLEIEALSTRRWDLLLDAAAVWAELGTTVWQARALLWHTELAGAEHPEARQVLSVLASPEGLAELFQAQVRGLHA